MYCFCTKDYQQGRTDLSECFTSSGMYAFPIRNYFDCWKVYLRNLNVLLLFQDFPGVWNMCLWGIVSGFRLR